MVKLKKEQFNKKSQSNKSVGLVKVPDVYTENIVIEPYDIIEDYNYDGHTTKNYYRVDSSVFNSVFDEIRNNPDCSFITPYNDVVKEGYIPEKVSVLIKHTHHHVEERVTSQILNFYGVGCPVNLSVVGDDIFAIDANNLNVHNSDLRVREALANPTGFYSYTMSMDFMSHGETLETFANDGEQPLYFNSLAGSISRVKEKVAAILESRKYSQLSSAEKKKIAVKLEEDFVMSLLVRSTVCADADFNTCNIGVLAGDDLKIINFDFEFSFGRGYNKGRSFELLQAAHEKYPEVCSRFVEKSKELYNYIESCDYMEANRVFKNGRIFNPLKENLNFVKNVALANFGIKYSLDSSKKM